MKRDIDDMLPEYDFTGKKGVRGKYAKAYKAGHSVRVYSKGKIIREDYFAAIEPDVHAYFPDSISINKALRKLISIFPNKPQPAPK
ncbi:MAG: hypothetical protein ACKVRN_00830 [Pyrinomonadaceae bacterium]